MADVVVIDGVEVDPFKAEVQETRRRVFGSYRVEFDELIVVDLDERLVGDVVFAEIEGLLEALERTAPLSAQAELRGPAINAPFRLGPAPRLRSLHRRAHCVLGEHLALRAALARDLERSYQIQRRFRLG